MNINKLENIKYLNNKLKRYTMKQQICVIIKLLAFRKIYIHLEAIFFAEFKVFLISTIPANNRRQVQPSLGGF